MGDTELSAARTERFVTLWTDLLKKRPGTVHVTPDQPEDVNELRAAARKAARALKMRVRTSVLEDGRVAVRWLDFEDSFLLNDPVVAQEIADIILEGIALARARRAKGTGTPSVRVPTATRR